MSDIMETIIFKGVVPFLAAMFVVVLLHWVKHKKELMRLEKQHNDHMEEMDKEMKRILDDGQKWTDKIEERDRASNVRNINEYRFNKDNKFLH